MSRTSDQIRDEALLDIARGNKALKIMEALDPILESYLADADQKLLTRSGDLDFTTEQAMMMVYERSAVLKIRKHFNKMLVRKTVAGKKIADLEKALKEESTEVDSPTWQ